MNAALQNYFNSLCCGGGCQCPGGYTKDPKTGLCVKEETAPPTVMQQGICLANTDHYLYGVWGSRIYKTPFNNAALGYGGNSGSSDIVAEMHNSPQWRCPGDGNSVGPMNRAAVWIDSDCNGSRDTIAAGGKTTIAYRFNNTGAARTIFVGVGGDNVFQLKVNGQLLADSGAAGGEYEAAYKVWHLIPVAITEGINDFNLVATGDGTANDATAMVLYDNTAAQLQAATADNQLSILYNSRNGVGTPYDIATCPTGWSLDTTAGSGHYVCRRTLTTPCS